ncbi:MAG: DUF6290 family protein [Oscillospiraceae bacterium]|nr:DUF6290 family protein [Oscillospiraceae bacterium]MDY6207468.1 DUF6290 family protein [Oscillospiraceae bacterium]
MSKKSTEYRSQYNKKNYSRIEVYFPKKDKEAIAEYCKKHHYSQAEFIKDLVYNKIGDYIEEYRIEAAKKEFDI